MKNSLLVLVLVLSGSILLSCGNPPQGKKSGNNVQMGTNHMQQDATDHSQHQGMHMSHDEVTNANALVCPVSGDKIAPEKAIVYQQNGYEFKLCCPTCVSEIKKDFEKYRALGKKI